jgi:hypothetical protein
MICGEQDTYGFGLEVKLDTGEISPREIWENKDHYIGLATASREEVWDTTSEDRQQALLRLVQASVERLHAHVADWVPTYIRAEGGEWVDVFWRISAEDIANEIVRHDEAVAADIAAATADTAEMLEGLT